MIVDESKIFAVVVTYNGRDDIERCLSSLETSTVPVRILVIDNQSNDETVDFIQRKFPSVEMMVAPENLGFGKGNNIGIKYAYESGAEHVFLLNQDAYVKPDTIEQLYTIQRKYKKYGLLSPLQLDGTGKQLDSKFARHLAKSPWINQILTDAFLSEKFKHLYEVDFLNAAAWMLSRNCIDKVGLFNPIFEHYGEDCEYAHRVLQKGLRVGLSNQSVAYHNRCQGSTSDRLNLNKNLMLEKAIIQYRLCRKFPRTTTNVISALSRALFVKGLRCKAQLFTFLLTSTYPTLRARDKAYLGNRVFFSVTPKFQKNFDL